MKRVECKMVEMSADRVQKMTLCYWYQDCIGPEDMYKLLMSI